ncbi:MAG: HAMP domain-containing protein [Thermoanaerobaculales bacterium]|nr:HAMP domain-containing protein [Thermoanaerobaculales bacterium]
MVRLNNMKTRLAIWFLVVALVPLLGTAALTYFQQVRTIKENVFDKLSAVRDLKVRELSNWIEERRGDIRTASGDNEIRRLGGPLHSEIRSFEQETTIEAVRELFRRYLANYGAFTEMFLIDAHTGRIAISSDPSSEGFDCRKNPYFTTPLETGELFIKDIYRSETLDRPAAVFSIPVFCLEHGGEHLIGVLVARIDLERSLYRLLQENSGMGRTGETLIVNSDGMVLSELLHYENAPLRLKIEAQSAALAAGGETGIIEVEDYRGVKVLAAYAHIPGTGWGFVAKQDQEEVYASIGTLTRDLGAGVAASVFLVLLITVLLARNIATPVLAMAGVAGRIQSGDLEARCSAVGRDEIASLGSSLNTMAEALQAEAEIGQGVAGLTEVLVEATTVRTLATGLLGALVETTPSHLASFFRRSFDGQAFDLIHSIGAGTRDFADFEKNYPEGQLDRALVTREISHLKDIPHDTVFTYRTIAGDAVPREMVAIPLAVRGRTEAVIALASLGEYSGEHMRIFETLQPGIGTALANVLAVEKTERTVEALEEANVELKSQSDELLEQTEELKQFTEELRRQKRQVEEAGRLKSQFLSNMSHELRTPLNSVLALSQLMISRGVGVEPEQDSEYLKIIERNGRALLDLINDVLDLSKIEAGHVHLQVSDFAVEDVVRMVTETARPLAEAKDLALKISLGDDLPTMHGDQDKVRRILLNLLSTAVKFTGTGSVSLAVQAVGGRLSFEVKDTGIGIEADELPRIFDEFRQVDGSPTRRFGGTGLGLAISRHLAGLLGGEISVTSHVGEGSTHAFVALEVSRWEGGAVNRGCTGAFDR